MVDITRPEYGTVWASEGEKLSPAQDKIKLGWVQEMMPFQWENFLQARQDEALLYLLQKGVPEYSPTQEYIANKSTVIYQGILYIASQTVTGVLPTVETSWKRVGPTIGANGAVSISAGGTGAITLVGAKENLGIGTLGGLNLVGSTGILVKTGALDVESRTLIGTSGNIVVTNPDGVAGNPVINVGTNVVRTNADPSWTTTRGIRLPSGSTGDRGVAVSGTIRYNTELNKFEGYNGTSWDALGATLEATANTFSGDGVTTTFSLSTAPVSPNTICVTIGGLVQGVGTYSVNGTQIVFSEAPTAGVDNIQVISLKSVAIGQTTANQVYVEDVGNYFTSSTAEGALQEIATARDRTRQTGPLNYAWATYGGLANTITLTPAFTRTAYATGDEFRFRATATNTGATTINVNGLGARTAVTVTGAALPAGYIRTGVDTVCVYDGTNFVVQREVEIGSNANGRYVKEADGRLTCAAVYNADTPTPTLWWGSMYISALVSMVFPHAFVGTANDVAYKRSDRYIEGASSAFGFTQVVTTTTISSYAVAPTPSGSCRLGYEATGRWY